MLAGSAVGATAEEGENGEEADSKLPPDQADSSSNKYAGAKSAVQLLANVTLIDMTVWSGTRWWGL